MYSVWSVLLQGSFFVNCSKLKNMENSFNKINKGLINLYYKYFLSINCYTPIEIKPKYATGQYLL